MKERDAPEQVQRGQSMNPKIEARIGKNIRKLREKKKMTQNGVSLRLQLKGCDVSRSALAKIEVGQRHLYPDEIVLLKEILGVSYEEIFDLK